MKFNKARKNNSSSQNVATLQTLSRKEKRKALVKEKKIKRALHYAKIKHTDKICINSNDLNNLKGFSDDSDLYTNLKSKVLANKTNNNIHHKTKTRKRKKSKNANTVTLDSNKDPDGSETTSSSFKMSDNTNLRLAKLQEYVNQESQKLKQEEKGKADNDKVMNPQDKLIKDEYKLKELKLGQRHDDIEFNSCARKLRLNSFQKKRVISAFAEDFAGLLEDIEDGTYSYASKYDHDEKLDSDSDEKFEHDLLAVLGKKDASDSAKKTINKINARNENIKKKGDHKVNGIDGESDDEAADDSPQCEEVNDIGEESEDESVNDEEEYSSNENFLDDEAEEDDECNEEDDDEPVDDREEIMFEGGTSTTGISSKKLQANVEPTMNSLFTLYSTDSEEDDSDLDDFVVDNDFVEYEEDVDDELDCIEKKVKNKNCSRIVGREQLSESDSGEQQESVETITNSSRGEHKRRRILSDSSDGEDLHCLRSPNKRLKKPKKQQSSSTINDEVDSENKEIKSNGPDVPKIILESEEISKAKKRKNKKPKKRKNGCFDKATEITDCNGSAIVVQKENVMLVSEAVNIVENKSKKKKQAKKKKNGKNTDDYCDSGLPKSILKDNKHNNIDHIVNNSQPKKHVSFSLPECNEVELANKKENIDGKEEYHEDIYGRLRDKAGNIIKTDTNSISGTKYVPPAMRKLMALNNSGKKKEQLAALQRNLKGLLNRLAESNMAGIINRIEGYYQTNSRNDMNDSLTKLFFEMLITPVLTPERLIQEHALMIAILSANIGPEVGAHILTEFVVQWVEELQIFQPVNDAIDSKTLDNMLLFIGQLYHFRVIDATLIYDILHKLVEKPLQAKEIDLILLVLRTIGFNLRKDDPLALKRFITTVQSKADQVADTNSDHNLTRVKFMLEVLTAIRNNNISKVPNYDPTHGLHLKTVMKGLIRKGCRTSDLKVSLQDLLKSKVVGKWWVVGSAWSGGLKEDMESPQETLEKGEIEVVPPISQLNSYSEEFRKKAAKLHMSRPPRINILYATTEGAENYMDAFEKLLQLKLRPNQEGEIFNVMLYCCIRCKEYKMFYAQLALKLCSFKKGFTRLLEFSLWDRFKELSDMKPRQVANLAKFVAHMVGEGGLNLSVFKVLNFVEADDKTVSFLRQALLAILLHPSGTYAVSRAFNNLCSVPKLKLLRQYLRLFIVKFINPKKVEGKEMKVLENRVKIVLDILNSVGSVKL